MRIYPFQAIYPNFNYIASPDSFFGRVKYEYPQYKESGFFLKAAQESVYIYRIEKINRTYIGLVASSDINDYMDGRIKKHENTLASKEQQQMHLMITRSAIVKPVLLTYPVVPEITHILKKYIQKHPPFYQTVFTKEKQTHTFWEVSDGKIIQRLQKLFLEKVPETYIADGHHRTSTTALMYKRSQSEEENKRNESAMEGNYHRLLSAFFQTDQLDIHDYNRVVEGLNDCSLTTFMAKISQLFDIELLEGPARPAVKHEIVMFVNKEWFLLRWKKKVLKQYVKETVVLDASLLDEKVLKPILGIEDIRTDQRIKYVEGPKGLDDIRSKAIKNINRVAFILYPVELMDLIKVADLGMTMPPKSTWFEPRIKNGLIVQEL
ncbi:MAG: DUF1015 family protein [Bacteroidota bacterium]